MAASNRWAVALLTRLVGAWRSLVARLPWAQEVRSSNLRAPTNLLLTCEPSNRQNRMPWGFTDPCR